MTVIFVSSLNSARSQMAEAFMNRIGAGRVIAESAGMHPGHLNAQAVAVMREKGIDISRNSTKHVARMVLSRRIFDYVITVCDEDADDEEFPQFPGKNTRVHWDFPDPAGFTGTPEEKLAQTRALRDAIERQVREWCATVVAG